MHTRYVQYQNWYLWVTLLKTVRSPTGEPCETMENTGICAPTTLTPIGIAGNGALEPAGGLDQRHHNGMHGVRCTTVLQYAVLGAQVQVPWYCTCVVVQKTYTGVL